jgi:hypothetical protein
VSQSKIATELSKKLMSTALDGYPVPPGIARTACGRPASAVLGSILKKLCSVLGAPPANRLCSGGFCWLTGHLLAKDVVSFMIAKDPGA